MVEYDKDLWHVSNDREVSRHLQPILATKH
jgi:hypothetical protein